MPTTLRNTAIRYGWLSKFFHWTIVVLIILQYVIISRAESLPLGKDKFEAYKYHKSFGITILALAALRLLWRWINTVPALPNTLKPYERALAHITHWGLYILIFALPITGWLMSSASNFPVSYFGWFTLPNLVGPDKAFSGQMEDLHGLLFNILVAIAVLHILAALKHHFWLKDDVLRRMLPFGRLRSSSRSSRNPLP